MPWYAGDTLIDTLDKIGVTGCANNCLKAEENDIGIKGSVEPHLIPEKCVYCGACAKVCRVGAITVNRSEKLWAIYRDKCINCGRCVKSCGKAALRVLQGPEYKKKSPLTA